MIISNTSDVERAPTDVDRRVDALLAGAIALGEYGYQRLTVDVDVLIRRDDLARFKEQWLGRGYVEVRPKYDELWTLAQHPDEDY